MLKDKIALITGASRGLGLTTGKLFLKEGAKIVVISRKREDLEKSWEDGENVMLISGDVSSEERVKRIFEKIMEKYGTVDIIVNNAGIALAKKVTDTTLDEWNNVLAVNATATFLMSREGINLMIKNNIRGKIINIASIAGKLGLSLASAYSASKAAVIGFTNAIAREVASYGINVNAICPGAMDTDMYHKDTIIPFSKMFNTDEETLLKKAVSSIPLKRLLKTEEVASLVLYLASSRGDGITGQSINIDCGTDIHS